MYRQQNSMSGPSLTPAIKNLLIANGVIFVMMILPFFQELFIYYFSLIPYRISTSFQIWRLVSYMFLHGGFFHIAMNMFALWMFGSALERIWGSKEFYKFYFITGIFAGFSSVIFNFGSMIPIIGASGSVYGILMAVALLFPDNEIFIIPFPFPIKMKFLALGLGAISILNSISATQDGIAHIAHLGGMVAGYLYLKSKYGNRIQSPADWFKKKKY